MELDWIGAYDCWADVSAWRYWANATDWLYQDVANDLDAIDHIKPKRVLDPKTGTYVVINDPATIPGYIMKRSKNDTSTAPFIYDMGAVNALSIGGIRQLRAETKTYNEGQDARIERLEKLVESLTNKKLEDIVFVSSGTAFKGLSKYVVMDGRLSKDSKVVVTFKGNAGNYHIAEQTNGSFTLVFDAPVSEDVQFNYSSTMK